MANAALERNPYFSGPTRTTDYTTDYNSAYGTPGAVPRSPVNPAAANSPTADPYAGTPYAGNLGAGGQGAGGQFAGGQGAGTLANVMTVEDTIQKGAGLFGVMLAVAAVTWFLPSGIGLGLAVLGGIGAFVLSLVIAFRKTVSVPAIFTYAVAEGLLVGGLSKAFEQLYPGVVLQATLATICVVGVTLALFSSGKVRTSPRGMKFLMIAMLGYLAFSLVNVVLMWTGVSTDPWGLRSVEVFGIPLGVILGVFAVLMGAYLLVSDFEFIQNGARFRAPREQGWLGAYAVVSTVVYIYVELLRLIAIFRSSD